MCIRRVYLSPFGSDSSTYRLIDIWPGCHVDSHCGTYVLRCCFVVLPTIYVSTLVFSPALSLKLIFQLSDGVLSGGLLQLPSLHWPHASCTGHQPYTGMWQPTCISDSGVLFIYFHKWQRRVANPHVESETLAKKQPRLYLWLKLWLVR